MVTGASVSTGALVEGRFLRPSGGGWAAAFVTLSLETPPLRGLPNTGAAGVPFEACFGGGGCARPGPEPEPDPVVMAMPERQICVCACVVTVGRKRKHNASQQYAPTVVPDEIQSGASKMVCLVDDQISQDRLIVLSIRAAPQPSLNHCGQASPCAQGIAPSEVWAEG